MANVSQKSASQLKKIIKNIRNADEYWQDNLNNYHKSRSFVFDTTISDYDKQILTETKKAVLEFNVIEAYLSRLMGEWSKQTPSFSVHTRSFTPVDVDMIQLVSGHLRLKLDEANARESFSDEIYKEMLSGGYSVMKIETRYSDHSTFDQDICFKHCDPTMVTFDPLARLPTKSDARFVYEKIPMTEDEFRLEFGQEFLDNINSSGSTNNFKWVFHEGATKIIMVVDYYKKVIKKDTLVFLSNGQTMPLDDYNKMAAAYVDTITLEILPTIKRRRRIDRFTVERFRVIEDQVLAHEETDFQDLPYVFVDGNSVYINKHAQDSDDPRGNYQKTRTYFKNAVDAQRLKNLCAQQLATEIQNMAMHKWAIAQEAIPDQEAYKQWILYPQLPNTAVFKAYSKEGLQLPPPFAAPRNPAPPELYQTFMGADQMMQAILGSYDSSLGINDNQLSGVAIVEGATQSNNAAMPFVMHYLQALTAAAQIFINLIPKFYVTTRTMPYLTIDNRRAFVEINNEQNPQSLMVRDYSNPLEVCVEAGMNFEVQQNRSLQFVTQMAQSFPSFQAMINKYGLSWLCDQLSIKGVEQLKQMAQQFTQEQAQQMQQQAQQAQQQPQSDPALELVKVEQQKVDAKIQNDKTNAQLNMMKLQLQQEKQEMQRMQIQLRAYMDQQAHLLDLAQAETDRDTDAARLTIEKMKQHSSVLNDIVKTLGV